jgi:hypothetical protein
MATDATIYSIAGYKFCNKGSVLIAADIEVYCSTLLKFADIATYCLMNLDFANCSF